MEFTIETLNPGSILNNARLCEVFRCSPQGGMRRAHKTNTLVIVSDHYKSLYDDRWQGNELHYTGMGRVGDQSLENAQNKTLAQSNTNGISVHLFEVFVEKEYTYIGQVKLISAPYFEEQPDENGLIRKVCVFPLRLTSNVNPILDSDYVRKPNEKKAKIATRLTDEEVRKRAKSARKKTGTRSTTSQQYDRDQWVAENAKRRARGICMLCETPAPFTNSSGVPYLETHHIVWLAKGGEDSIENTVALCPNCHKKMHILNLKQDIEHLKSKNEEASVT